MTKKASDQPFLDLGKAFTTFFAVHAHRPKFKRKKRSKPSFYRGPRSVGTGRSPPLDSTPLGWVNLAEKLRFTGKVTGARITKTAECGLSRSSWRCLMHFQSTSQQSAVFDVGLSRLATLPYGRGSREPGLPHNRPQETASGRAFACIAAHQAQKTGSKHAESL